MENFYGDVEEAVELSGVEAYLTLDSMQKSINIYVDMDILNSNGDFFKHDIADEYFTFKFNTSSLLLKHFPIIKDTLELSANGDVLNKDAYVVDSETGIVTLLQNINPN